MYLTRGWDSLYFSVFELLPRIVFTHNLVSADYHENELVNRLFGKYRLSFVGGTSCLLDEIDGKTLFAENPAEVPTEENFNFFSDSEINP